MSQTIADLLKNQQLPPVTFDLTPEWVSAYAAAVDDAAIADLARDAVPPMAIAALSIRALLENASLAPGTVHAGQELSFVRSVAIGDSLEVNARVASRGERAGWVLMSVDLQVTSGGSPVMSGRATVTFPAESP